MRILFWVICSFVAGLANLILAPRLMFSGFCPDFLLVIVVFLALFEEQLGVAVFLALLFGCCSDFMSSGMFGYKTVTFLGIIVFAAFLKKNTINNGSMFLEIIATLIAVLWFAFCSLFFSFFYGADIKMAYFTDWLWRFSIAQVCLVLLLVFPLKRLFVFISFKKKHTRKF